ncbi:hypothetical protein KP509_05G059100 [Ceratopteris richardii]|uniref:UDP-3-O-acyl-N-acetylglucosamine deacetylase n=1 Tax=Ceratopteris richardii TaxID=49495 RepID=A0A8T2URB8_CERRI|nr:hypothetical protein KP509_05G059100 [Ceratopteris richardii]KAH7437160.1 hypothetical protein KP509_05G059100 [Ceratopteris richardii]
MIAFFRCCRSSHLIKRSSTSLFSTASSQPGDFQRTLLNAVSRSGIGLHTGITAQVRLLPAPAGVGRYFVHLSDDGQTKEEEVQVPASIHSVKETNLSTCIGQGDVRIRTIEHLLSALEGLGVHNCRIEIHGGNEVPLLDGSAKTWVDAIHEAGITFALDDKGDKLEHINFSLMEPVYVSKGDSFVAAFPSQDLRITYGIDFCEVPAIRNQWFSIHLDKDSTYMREISPARTFCIREQVKECSCQGTSFRNTNRLMASVRSLARETIGKFSLNQLTLNISPKSEYQKSRFFR